MMTEDELSDIEARALAAGGEAGVWSVDSSWGMSHIIDADGDTVVYDEGAPSDEARAHIVGMCPAETLRLVAEVRKLKLEISSITDLQRDRDTALSEQILATTLLEKYINFS